MISKDGYVGWKVHEVNFLPPQLSSFTKLSSLKDHTFTVSSLTDTTYSPVGSQHTESTSLGVVRFFRIGPFLVDCYGPFSIRMGTRMCIRFGPAWKQTWPGTKTAFSFPYLCGPERNQTSYPPDRCRLLSPRCEHATTQQR